MLRRSLNSMSGYLNGTVDPTTDAISTPLAKDGGSSGMESLALQPESWNPWGDRSPGVPPIPTPGYEGSLEGDANRLIFNPDGSLVKGGGPSEGDTTIRPPAPEPWNPWGGSGYEGSLEGDANMGSGTGGPTDAQGHPIGRDAFFPWEDPNDPSTWTQWGTRSPGVPPIPTPIEGSLEGDANPAIRPPSTYTGPLTLGSPTDPHMGDLVSRGGSGTREGDTTITPTLDQPVAPRMSQAPQLFGSHRRRLPRGVPFSMTPRYGRRTLP